MLWFLHIEKAKESRGKASQEDMAMISETEACRLEKMTEVRGSRSGWILNKFWRQGQQFATI